MANIAPNGTLMCTWNFDQKIDKYLLSILKLIFVLCLNLDT